MNTPVKPPVKPTKPPVPAVQLPRPTDINRDPLLLHPAVRQPVEEILTQLQYEKIPFRLFEGYRTPARQAYLYAQGRSRPGGKVTNAVAWQSFHQFGLAVDLVLFENGKWSWDDKGGKADWWDRMYELAHQYDLDPLQFEKPHIQLAHTELKTLMEGSFPGGGDESWWGNLKSVIEGWKLSPSGPRLLSA